MHPSTRAREHRGLVLQKGVRLQRQPEDFSSKKLKFSYVAFSIFPRWPYMATVKLRKDCFIPFGYVHLLFFATERMHEVH